MWRIAPMLFFNLVLPIMAEAEAPSDVSPRVAQLEDIATFRSQFLDIDRSYSQTARAQASQRLATLEQAAGSTSPGAFLVELCAIAALADNAHSECSLPQADETQIGFTVADGRFFVTSAPPEHAALLGGELTALDGRPISALQHELRKLHGGLPAYRDLFAVQVLSRPDLLHSLGLAESPDAAAYRVHAPDGGMLEQRLERTHRSPARSVLPLPDKTPWSLQDPSQLLRWRDAPELAGVVIQLRVNSDTDKQKIQDFLLAAEAERVRLRRRNVILDMRQNSGGNFLTTRDFMMGWPKKLGPAGRIFVLISPKTLSAGIVSIAYLKQAGSGQVVLVGAPPGDRLTFFAEGRETVLAHSGIGVLPALERDDVADGCRRYTDCIAVLAQPGSPTGSPKEKQEFLDKFYGRKPLAVESLDPDIPAPWTIDDYLAGRDPAMEALKRALPGMPRRSASR